MFTPGPPDLFGLQLLQVLSQSLPVLNLDTTDSVDEVIVLEQNLLALITQFAISEQEEALAKALPQATCK